MDEFDLSGLKKTKPAKNVRLQIMMSKDILERFDKFVDENGLDRAKLLERVIETYMNKIENK